MSAENRSSSALFKRAEQLKRWEESETNRESSTPRNKSKKIQFSLECVFLAACASGDKDEVLRLLNVGADIDTSNVDGLSALHQACIDDNLDMVEFLVKYGADINKGDNEGWTPLHATASCGFISIAKYLIEQGADVAAVNNDGELAVDIAESDEMEDLLHAVLKEKGIEPDDARNKEERIMLQHAREWLNSGKFDDIPHEKTGATALHVAASKGYIKVMDTLIQAGADVDAKDFDGWTPLHAAAHWGQKEACEILVENFCDMDKKNYVINPSDTEEPELKKNFVFYSWLSTLTYRTFMLRVQLIELFFHYKRLKQKTGQTAFDVSEGEMVRLLEDLRKKQSSLQKDRSDIKIMNMKGTPSPKKSRLSLNDKLVSLKDKDSPTERQSLNQLIMEEDPSPVEIVPKKELIVETEREIKSNISEKNENHSHVTNDDKQISNLPDITSKVPINSVPSNLPSRTINENEDVRVPSWRKPVSFKNVIRTPFRFEDEKQSWTNSTSADKENINNDEKTPEVALRRTQSFEADDKFYRRYCELKAKIESGNSHPALIPPTNNTSSLPTRSASLKEKARKGLMHEDILAPATLTQPSYPATSITNSKVPLTVPEIAAVNSISVPHNRLSDFKNGLSNAVEQTTVSAPTTPTASKLSPGNIFKNFFKSFVPPVRDEESETQRKAHAKRVRETRRSTQGVTLEEIKSAEQLVKKKQQQQLQQASSQLNSSTPSTEPTSAETFDQQTEPSSISISATITTGSPTIPQSNKCTNERRPSWRLRLDTGCKFKLEDVRCNEKDSESMNENNSPNWSSAPTTNESTDTTSVTLPLRKNNKFSEDSEQVKVDKDRSVPILLPVNARRKRPKRRSTGAVTFDNEEDNERLNCENEVNDIADDDSGGGDKSGHSSRLSSTGSLGDDDHSNRSSAPSAPSENGELDYKKLYEAMLTENEILRDKLKKADDELTDCKLRLTDSSKNSVNQNSLSEIEKREKRAMERKLSEMEEELKQLQKLKAENERLRAENRALTRVVSKLTTSANAVK